MTVFFTLNHNAVLRNLSLIETEDDAALYKSYTWNDRDVYFIKYNFGKDKVPLNFVLTVKTQAPHDMTMKLVEIVVSGHYVHAERNMNTDGFIDFLLKFPEWADITPALANYELWYYQYFYNIL